MRSTKFSNMADSTDYLDIIPDLCPTNDATAIPLHCWQDIRLCDIWIPSRLLPNRTKPSNTRATRGPFHTLQKRGYASCIESFSVFHSSDSESDDEIILSDFDDDDLGLDSNKNILEAEKLQAKKSVAIPVEPFLAHSYNSVEAASHKSGFRDSDCISECIQNEENISRLKSFPSVSNLCEISKHFTAENTNEEIGIGPNVLNTDLVRFFNDSNGAENELKLKNKEILVAGTNDPSTTDKNDTGSNVSLHEILDTTEEVSIKDFNLTEDCMYSALQKSSLEDFTEINRKKNKKDKKKKKIVKAVALDKFLENYTEQDRQEDYCNTYLQKVLRENAMKVDDVQVRNVSQFPNLAPNAVEFMHSERKKPQNETVSNIKSITETLFKPMQANENQDVTDCLESQAAAPITTSLGKLIIKNIPAETSHEDIYAVLCEFVEIKNFTTQPDGKFVTGFVEIDLSCDIDWIVECLNGTDIFGASSEPLICYRQ